MQLIRVGLSALMLAFCVAACGGAQPQSLPESNVPTPEPQTSIVNAQQPVQLDILTRTGPWPVASRLIGYNGRLWFANSVKGINHNAADIWSIDLASGAKRYERSLFSQDAGLPLVYDGLLYWPLEDALLAFGDGIMSITDGEDWARMTIPGSPIYHSYEALDWKDDLLALAAAGDTALHRKITGQNDWQQIVRHTAPRGKIARLKELTKFDGAVYAVLRDGKKRRLARWSGIDGEQFEDVLPWPRYKYLNGLTVHKDALFALVGRGAAREIWRHDGQASYRVGPAARFADLASDGENLWTVTFEGDLLSSTNGDVWERHKKLNGGRPNALTIVDGGLFASGTGSDDKGIIWWQKGHQLKAADPAASQRKNKLSRLDIRPKTGTSVDWQKKGAEIDALLADPNVFGDNGGELLGDRVVEAIANGAPRGFFAQRLKSKIAIASFSGFGGDSNINSVDVSQLILLWAMAQSQHADVPPALLLKPWRSKQNSYEKYLEPAMAAIHAVAMAKQGDKATIDALLKRLEFKDDPDWLHSQVIGALTAATGQHFGYDIDAWREWNDAR